MLQRSELQRYLSEPEVRRALELPEDASPDLEVLGQGEYNLNYVLTHPVTGEKLVLRVNTGSQMHLDDQIGYEYGALELLAPSGRTPKPVFCDGSKRHLPYGLLVMEWLPGVALDYHKDLDTAAAILADIHSLPVAEPERLIEPEHPLAAIYAECQEMVSHYFAWSEADPEVVARLDKLNAAIGKLPLEAPANAPRCIVNTELNSGNFLINPDGRSYLVDWEKPLYSEPAQDLGHFLAPTTTFWKTPVILTPEAMRQFVKSYIRCLDGRMDTSTLAERLSLFLTVTCLRGVTWCAMARVEYAKPDRPLKNQDTFEKILAYLEPTFLDRIYEDYVVNDFLAGVV